MEYPCQNCSKLLPRNTVDDEVDGAVEHGQVASYHIHQHLPFWHEICPIRRVEALNDETISNTEKRVIFSLPGISPRQIIHAPYKVRQNKWNWSQSLTFQLPKKLSQHQINHNKTQPNTTKVWLDTEITLHTSPSHATTNQSNIALVT